MKIRFGIGLGADTVPDQLAAIIDRLETSATTTYDIACPPLHRGPVDND